MTYGRVVSKLNFDVFHVGREPERESREAVGPDSLHLNPGFECTRCVTVNKIS